MKKRCRWVKWPNRPATVRSRPRSRWPVRIGLAVFERELGLPADVWTALALEDEAAFRAELAADPSLVNAKHPLFEQPILEMAPDHFREILIENGADVSSISNRVLLGDLEGARQMIDHGDFTVDEGQETAELLMHAIGCQQDDFACYLLDRGACPALPLVERRER